MTCDQTLDRIEAIAAGDEAADDAFRRHVEGCASCASAFSAARRVERLLADRPSPAAPSGFSAAVVARIRRDRWRSEEQIDRVFNATLALAVITIAVGGLALLNLGGVTDALIGALSAVNAVIAESGSLASAPPGPSVYLLVSALLMSAAGLWWWVEVKE